LILQQKRSPSGDLFRFWRYYFLSFLSTIRVLKATTPVKKEAFNKANSIMAENDIFVVRLDMASDITQNSCGWMMPDRL
jgi:hypothetical protein